MKHIKIQYDPYRKKFSFEVCSDGKNFESITGSSNLARFTNDRYAFNNNIAEILRIIDRDYTQDSDGATVYFHGCAEDFADFERAFARFMKRDPKPQLRLGCGAKDCFPSAEDANRIIDADHHKMLKEFEGVTEIENILEKYNDTVKTDFNLVVTGTYSSGKSTFINALVGEELLPEGADPVTACVVKISDSDRYSVQFKSKEYKSRITIQWENGAFVFNDTDPRLTELKRAISDAAKSKDKPVEQMHAVIDYFNRTGRRQIEDCLEVTLPFKGNGKINELIKNAVQLHIYDTPGAAAETEVDHSEILKEALGRQTNALPLILVQRKDLARTGEADLQKMLKEYETTLDLTNAVIVVTHGDIIPQADLENGIDEKVSKAWNTYGGIFFVSSVVALGYKKQAVQENLVSRSYLQVYSSRIKDTFNPADDFYCKLYKYDDVADADKEQIEQAANDAAVEDRLYHDSGMYAVEYVISRYASRYLKYLKAQKSCTLLQDALDAAHQQRKAKMKEEEKIKSDYEQKKKEKLNALKDRLTGYNPSDAEYSAIHDKMEKKYKERNDAWMDGLDAEAKKIWREIKEKYTYIPLDWNNLWDDLGWHVSGFLNLGSAGEDDKKGFVKKMTGHCNDYLRQIFPDACDYSKELYKELSNDILEKLYSIVDADHDLTEQAKEDIKFTIRNADRLQLRELQMDEMSFDEGVIDFLFLHTIDPKSYARQTKEIFKAHFKKHCIDEIHNSHTADLKSWLAKIKQYCNANLEKINVVLKDYTEKIQKLTDAIGETQKHLDNMEEVEHELKTLLVANTEVENDG